jgi:hypothetical protein
MEEKFPKQRILKLKKDARLSSGITFKKGTEIELVNGVAYVGGFPVQFEANYTILKWVEENPSLFTEDYRRFK